MLLYAWNAVYEPPWTLNPVKLMLSFTTLHYMSFNVLMILIILKRVEDDILSSKVQSFTNPSPPANTGKLVLAV